MLYVTTRNKHDAYTAYRTIHQDRGAEGGLFLPMRMPEFSPEQIAELGQRAFGQNVADILNLFFSTSLTSWDVDMAIGRYPTAIRSVNYRILISEWWHNPGNSFHSTVEALAKRICGDAVGDFVPSSDWVRMAVRIAFLFGVFGDLIRRGEVTAEAPLDVVVTSGSFATPFAAWYARAMGLPVGTIICGCNDNGGPWELLNRGELDTDAVTLHTSTPECDLAVPPDLERVICCTLGHEEAMRYSWICAEGGTYIPPESQLGELNKGLFAAVVSEARVRSIIPSVYRTSRCVLDPYAALAYGALADYRVRTGFGGKALLIAESSPLCNAAFVAKTMQIGTDALMKRLEES